MSNVDKIIDQLQNNVLCHMIMLYTGEGYIQLYSPNKNTTEFIDNLMKMKNNPDFIQKAILYSFMYKLALVDEQLQLSDKQIYNKYKFALSELGRRIYNSSNNQYQFKEINQVQSPRSPNMAEVCHCKA